MHDVLFVLWFFAPAGFANLAPVLANNVPVIKRYSQPIDFGKTFRGKRILGDHKTFRGIAAGIVMGLLVGSLQMLAYNNSSFIRDVSGTIDYSHPVYILMGATLGFGALCGDSVKSFFKRQIGVAPGKSWIPFDQIDFILGAIIFSLPFTYLGLRLYLLVTATMALLHPMTNLLGWILKLKENPF